MIMEQSRSEGRARFITDADYPSFVSRNTSLQKDLSKIRKNITFIVSRQQEMQRSNRELASLNKQSEHFRTQILKSHLASCRDFQNSQKEARIRKFMSGFNRNQTTTLSHADLAYAKQLSWHKSEKELIENVVDYLEKRTESTPSLSKTLTQSTSQKTIQTAQKSAKRLCNIPVRLLSPIRYKPKISTEKEDSPPPR
jgi:hypothetical protein